MSCRKYVKKFCLACRCNAQNGHCSKLSQLAFSSYERHYQTCGVLSVGLPSRTLNIQIKPDYCLQKIPPSGGSPAYKLTLPHQVVHAQLLHLVDEVFELSPSTDAQQSWQGSIAPRRNKERSEYTLQVRDCSVISPQLYSVGIHDTCQQAR